MGSWTDHPRAVAPVAVSIVLEVLAILVVGLRFYSHRLKRVSTASHDIAILVALVFSSGLVVCVIAETVMGGLGQHITQLSNPESQMVYFAKIYLAVSPIWGIAISSVKISIILLYISIFRRRPTFVRSCYVLIILQGLWCVGVILASMLLCQPISTNWDGTVQGHCGSAMGAYLSLQILNLVFDVAVGLWPIPVLWTLQLQLARKIELTCVFSLGIAICIITITRIILVDNLFNEDLTYSATPLHTFTILETLLGTILACLPMLRPAIERLSTLASVQSTLRMLRESSVSTKRDNSRHSEFGSSTVYPDTHSIGSTTNLNRTTVTSDHYDLEAVTGNRPTRPVDAGIFVKDTWSVSLGERMS